MYWPRLSRPSTPSIRACRSKGVSVALIITALVVGNSKSPYEIEQHLTAWLAMIGCTGVGVVFLLMEGSEDDNFEGEGMVLVGTTMTLMSVLLVVMEMILMIMMVSHTVVLLKMGVVQNVVIEMVEMT